MNIKNLPRWAINLSVSVCLLSACEKHLGEAIPDQSASFTQPDTAKDNLFFSKKRGVIKQGIFQGQSITYEEIDGKAFWQGDIELSKEDITPIGTTTSPANGREKGAGLSNEPRRWPQGRIPYEIGPGLDQTAISVSMSYWEDKTPIRFIPRTNEFDYIRFEGTDMNFNRSEGIGRKGGMQRIFLNDASKSSTPVIAHEIGHALGLVHEHARDDWFLYINIHPENFQEGWTQANFQGYGKEEGNVKFDQREGFDFGSIMLYGSFDVSRKNSDGSYVGPVMTKKKDGSTWNQFNPQGHLTPTPSYYDKETIRAMYANVYIVRNDILYAVTNQGQRSKLGSGWSGAAQTIAEDRKGSHIYTIQGGMLWRTNRLTGSFQQWAPNSGNWSGTVGLAGQDDQGNLFAQQGDHLWRIDKYGARHKLGGGGWLTSWHGTKALYYHKGWLYVLWKNKLYKVNPTTGAYTAYGGDWTKAKTITTANSLSDNLYLMVDDQLWSINVQNGQYGFVVNGFPNTTAMTGHADRLYIVSDNKMYLVDKNGNKLKDKTGQTIVVGGMDQVTAIGTVNVFPLNILNPTVPER
ncbi:M12 family metallopeptidase [Dyadobacter fermentans]|uniref:M12 family metallopeptidase n=1 Tax=Dyadobacter fermentans TaxID=94254 RepID=UPI001CBB7165|nr:M12 family metallopeptidase [Dyadobacter fermentans]MBZ1357188.1 hypothetical protein [Dyadobacter fermentans]